MIFLSGLAHKTNMVWALVSRVVDIEDGITEMPEHITVGYAPQLTEKWLKEVSIKADDVSLQEVTQALMAPGGLSIPGVGSAKLRPAEEVIADEYSGLADIESLLIYYPHKDAHRDILASMQPMLEREDGMSTSNEAYYIAQDRVMQAVARCSDRSMLHAMLDYLVLEYPKDYTKALAQTIGRVKFGKSAEAITDMLGSFDVGHVLDPFAGGGSTGLAAFELGMSATLIERDAAQFEAMKQTLKFIGAVYG